MKENVSFDNDKFAKAINDCIFEKRFSYRDFADVTGVSASTITRLVSHRKNPDADSLARIIDWMGVDFWDFIKRTRDRDNV